MMPHPLFAHFGHQMELFALIAKLATRRHHLHQSQIGSPSGTTCIGSKFGHQVASLHCHIALNCPIGIISWYPHQPESHQLSITNL